MDDDASYRDQDPSAQLQQSFAQHVNLSAGASGTGSPQAQLLHQDVRRGGGQNAKLVGPEAGATGAVDLEVVQLLYTILYVTALAVDPFVNPLRTLFHVGDDKAGIVFGVLIGSADDLGFDDDAAHTRPLPGLVADFPVDMFGPSAAPRELARSPHSAFDHALHHCILSHRDYIFQFRLGVQKLQHGRMRKTAIQAYPNRYSRNMVTNHPHHTPQHGNRTHRCFHVPSPSPPGTPPLLP